MQSGTLQGRQQVPSGEEESWCASRRRSMPQIRTPANLQYPANEVTLSAQAEEGFTERPAPGTAAA